MLIISDEWHKIVRCCLFVTMETPKATINEHNIYDINTIFWLFDHNLKKKKKSIDELIGLKWREELTCMPKSDYDI